MHLRFALALSFTATFAFEARAQSLFRAVNGPAVGAQFGRATIRIPDQNSDGFPDFLVGAPGFNQERGAILCLSGAFLAGGTGAQTLWSLAPNVSSGDRFGWALADLGDVNGDGVHDFLVGQPGFDTTANTDVGAVSVVNGATHTVTKTVAASTTRCEFGSSIAAFGDQNSDGVSEIAIGAPGPGQPSSYVKVFDGLRFGASSPLELAVYIGGSHEVGASLAAAGDLTGDGRGDFLVGSPTALAPGPTGGRVFVASLQSPNILEVGRYTSPNVGERLGSSIDLTDDMDGDGVRDVIAGAPNFQNGTGFEVGRAVVLSTARFIAQTPPYEIRSFAYGTVSPPVNHSDPDPDFHFGAAVRACGDLNGDGAGDFLVGAPGYFTQSFFPAGWNFRGLVRLFSGATGTQLASITGSSTDRLGDALAGAVTDLDGDGFQEFALAGSLSDAGGTDTGVLKCYRLFPLAPSTYCVGKVNSLGCSPSIGSNGSASATSASPFTVSAVNVINQKSGLLFYAHAPAAVFFQGGTKCVANPTVRTAVQNSGGSASGSDCTGVFSHDFNALIQSSVDPTLTVGAEVFSQYWSRDPASPSTTSLSNALRFVVNP